MFLFLSSTTSALASNAGQPVMSGVTNPLVSFETREECDETMCTAGILSPALQRSVTVSSPGLHGDIRHSSCAARECCKCLCLHCRFSRQPAGCSCPLDQQQWARQKSVCWAWQGATGSALLSQRLIEKPKKKQKQGPTVQHSELCSIFCDKPER